MTFKTSFKLALTSTLFYSVVSQASNYVPDVGSSLNFAIKYSLGTHKGIATSFKGLVDIEPNTMTLRAGTISFDVTSLNSGNATRDCHIAEAVGLNYKTSDYPADHVCDSNNKIPTTGKNAIAYPTVNFSIVSATLKATAAVVKATFTMHGVSKTMDIPATVTKEGNKIRVISSFPLMMSAFGIETKPFLGVKVKDQADITVNLLLKPQD